MNFEYLFDGNLYSYGVDDDELKKVAIKRIMKECGLDYADAKAYYESDDGEDWLDDNEGWLKDYFENDACVEYKEERELELDANEIERECRSWYMRNAI